MIITNRVIQISLCGSSGKMGQALRQKINQLSAYYKLTGELTSKDDVEQLENFCKNAEIIIDFSSPVILSQLLTNCTKYNKNIVIGTTGLESLHLRKLKEASENIAIVYSPNMSIGINLTLNLIGQLAKILDENYDIEIIDNHHRFKKDAPSGTALMLGKAITQGRNLKFEDYAIFDRHLRGERKKNEIGFSSIRAGDNYGEHEIIFAGNDEVIKVKHQALSRGIFAAGALKAASWLIDKEPGLYTMQDVLNISPPLDL